MVSVSSDMYFATSKGATVAHGRCRASRHPSGYGPGMPETSQTRTSGSIPPRGQRPAVGREGQRAGPEPGTTQAGPLPARGHVPEPHRLVRPPGGDHPPAGSNAKACTGAV